MSARRALRAEEARFPLARPFAIARGTRVAIDLVTVEIEEEGRIGRGEGAPSARYGESARSVLAQIAAMREAIENGMGRAELRLAMAPGAARNALDCALWDLEAKLGGVSVTARTGPVPDALVTAVTVGIDTPLAMAQRARDILQDCPGTGPAPLLKIKLDREDVVERVKAVRAAAPGAVLIADANESWDIALLEHVMGGLAEAGIALLEQPLPAGGDAALEGFACAVPLAADESAHVADDVAHLAGRYDFVTIKLDKSGGLSEALALADAAREAGMGVMTGCMLCSSLSVAAGWHVAARSRFVDLDGPLWLARDREGGAVLRDGMLHAPVGLQWGYGFP
ncbi:dipeptide epimerase [Novosphingobium mangrovi (ex Hu et al. 2023)]|uniref:Dipeptide epimerase n=1 Tax=Novosphingobium mangrovi (ex Hu et al. 2023) TaxID=2930094 RepID=A0ABT0A7N0_9SPHN|nr:dipeptide epimerase [Novosphingobium mangrovi (ex Hu et al. 2023)]MCJ1959173.1 dipeptide epimerase [Novosphingobium mangrovi (ex Hu et al. 2023)]